MDLNNITNNSSGLDADNSDGIDVSNKIEMVNAELGNDSEDHANAGQSVDDLHALVPKELIPEKEMKFESEKVALEFYRSYAKSVGFGVRIWKAHTEVIEGKIVVLDRRFCCIREGERKSDIRDANVKVHRALTRCNCKAEMKISCRGTCEYRVVKFIPEHNHNYVSPEQAHLIRSHRKVSDVQKAEIDRAISCGLAQKETMELMAKQAGGHEHLGFISDDCKNYLR